MSAAKGGGGMGGGAGNNGKAPSPFRVNLNVGLEEAEVFAGFSAGPDPWGLCELARRHGVAFAWMSHPDGRRGFLHEGPAGESGSGSVAKFRAEAVELMREAALAEAARPPRRALRPGSEGAG